MLSGVVLTAAADCSGMFQSAKVGDAGADEGRIDEASGEGNAAEDVQW